MHNMISNQSNAYLIKLLWKQSNKTLIKLTWHKFDFIILQILNQYRLYKISTLLLL